MRTLGVLVLLSVLICHAAGVRAVEAAVPATRPTVDLAALPANTWVRLNHGEPPAAPWYRGLSGAVYCSKGGRIFFWGASFSNSAGSRYYAELFDPAANTWTQVGPKAAVGTAGPPLQLTFAMLVYDPERNRVIYPYVSGDPDRSGTWAFDLAAGKWIDLKANTSPRVVPNSAAVYDTRNNVVVLFGGSFDGGPQTWLYDSAGNTWRRAEPKTSPAARIWHNMTFDRKAGVAVLFGGHDGKRELSDTWTYDAARNDWTRKDPTVHPSPRCGHAMAYDVKNGVTVLFGGSTSRFTDEKNEEAFLYQRSHSDAGIQHADTWTYDAASNRWTKLQVAASCPAASIVSGAMVYDERNDVLVLMHPWKRPWPQSQQYNTSQVWAFRYRDRLQ